MLKFTKINWKLAYISNFGLDYRKT